jgi:hypothetical protein
MAVATITPLALVMDTASADLPDAAATAVLTGADGFSIAATVGSEGYGGNLLIKMVSVTNAASVIFNAGTKPPAMRADLGSNTVTLAADDVKYIVLEQGRYLQSDGTYTGTITGAGADTCLMAAFRLPRTV